MSSLANVSSGNILDVITIDDVKLHKTHWAYMCLSMACTVPAPLPSIENWAEILKAEGVVRVEDGKYPPLIKTIVSGIACTELRERAVAVHYAYPQRDIDFYLVAERSLFNLSFNVVSRCLA